MSVDTFLEYDALGLAGLVRNRDVSPLELVDAAIERIEQTNPRLNAVVWTMFERARAMAVGDLPDGPFRGVPFLLKDSLGDLEGAPTRQASRLTPEIPAARSATLTERYLRAGLIPLGKTNTPEFALLAVTDSVLYGPARNPWNPSRTPGGSSGGAAAAVAAGMAPMAHGNDFGGSIRMPASCCGLVGLKPTRGRLPIGPSLGEGHGGLEVEHVLTRSVRDCAAALDATAGPAPGDPYWAPPAPESYLAAAEQFTRPLRIGAVRVRPDGSALHPECVAAVDRAIDLCLHAGHRVEVVDPPAFWNTVAPSWAIVFAASLVADVDAIMENGSPGPGLDLLGGCSRSVYALGAGISAARYQGAINAMHAAGREAAAWHERFDVAMTSTLGTPPIPIDDVNIHAGFMENLPKLSEFAPFSIPANATGQPAISLPLHWSDDGLPIGVQFIAGFGEEDILLGLSMQLEHAAPWLGRRPLLS